MRGNSSHMDVSRAAKMNVGIKTTMNGKENYRFAVMEILARSGSLCGFNIAKPEARLKYF